MNTPALNAVQPSKCDEPLAQPSPPCLISLQDNDSGRDFSGDQWGYYSDVTELSLSSATSCLDLSSRDGITVETVIANHPSRVANQTHVIAELKLQLVKQQQEIYMLESQLNQYQVKNELLVAENQVFVDGLSQVAIQEQTSKFMSRTKGWFSRGKEGGSMQLLLDTNSTLMKDNAELQVTLDTVRKSFKAHVQDSMRNREMDKKCIEKLREEIASLRYNALTKEGDDDDATVMTDLNVTDHSNIDRSLHRNSPEDNIVVSDSKLCPLPEDASIMLKDNDSDYDKEDALSQEGLDISFREETFRRRPSYVGSIEDFVSELCASSSGMQLANDDQIDYTNKAIKNIKVSDRISQSEHGGLRDEVANSTLKALKSMSQSDHGGLLVDFEETEQVRRNRRASMEDNLGQNRYSFKRWNSSPEEQRGKVTRRWSTFL